MDDDAVEEPDDDGDEMADELADATNTRSSEGLDFALELDASSAVEKINYNKEFKKVRTLIKSNHYLTKYRMICQKY